jgi:CRP-like cAMP-binding protein
MLTPFQDRALRALAGCPVFGELEAIDLRWIGRTSVRKGELLFQRGDPSHRLYGLIGGMIKLFARDPDGHEVSLGLVAPGELVGELDLADGAPRHASAIAMAHSELATLGRSDLERSLDRRPELRTSLSRASAVAARRLAQRLEDAAFLSIERRVEKALIDLAARVGEQMVNGVRIHMRQQDLADLVGLSRESVSKVLTSPAMRGRVELHRGSIVLVAV